MSPRFDHRPPVVAFVFLVLIAVAVIGTSARALDGHFVQAGPLRASAQVKGVAVPAQAASQTRRVLAPSRSAVRPHHPAVARTSTKRAARVLAQSARHQAKQHKHAGRQVARKRGHAWGHGRP